MESQVERFNVHGYRVNVPELVSNNNITHQWDRIPYFTQGVKAANPNNGVKYFGNQHLITFEP
jgi:hypothetical protein